jgi:hypothetical protein
MVSLRLCCFCRLMLSLSAHAFHLKGPPGCGPWGFVDVEVSRVHFPGLEPGIWDMNRFTVDGRSAHFDPASLSSSHTIWAALACLLLACGSPPRRTSDPAPRTEPSDPAPPAEPSEPTPQAGSNDGSRVGDGCRTAEDCGPGYLCDVDVPGGYCLLAVGHTPRPCSGGNAAEPARDDHAPCPAGTRCSLLPRRAIEGVCLRACATAADCNPGQACAVLRLFPSEADSPRGPHPVCWAAGH